MARKQLGATPTGFTMNDLLTSAMVLGVYAIVMTVLAATFSNLWR